ncbi:MAG: hypothetical protein ACK4E3_01820 [Brevundimonas sp.]|jgi:hypothetical protein|uniref:hypothetical protein n=1 Tax=Brevundimonas sp. TaxID=1871086 RepID=UPI00391C585B
MMIGGYPLYVFLPLVVAMACSVVVLKGFMDLSSRLNPRKDTAGQDQITRALYASERRLHDLDVHHIVWRMRIAFVVQFIAILLFAYLIYIETA